MATNLVGIGSLKPTTCLYDEAFEDPSMSFQHTSSYSEQDEEDLILHSIPESTDESSPPRPEFPTWDTVPIGNFPDVLGSSFSSGYELRPGPRIGGKEAFSTWLDQDGTANYHPDCKRDPYLRPPVEIFEGKKRRRPIHPDSDINKRKLRRKITWQRGRFEGKQLPVTLSFTTERGKSALISFG